MSSVSYKSVCVYICICACVLKIFFDIKLVQQIHPGHTGHTGACCDLWEFANRAVIGQVELVRSTEAAQKPTRGHVELSIV